jgi:hypothetical protein
MKRMQLRTKHQQEFLMRLSSRPTAVIISFLLIFAQVALSRSPEPVFQILDKQSKDYRLVNVALDYAGQRTTQGFLVFEGNQPRLLEWASITSLEIGGSVDGTPGKLSCTIQHPDGAKQAFACVDGVVLGRSRNGEYRKPLNQVTKIIPPN